MMADNPWRDTESGVEWSDPSGEIELLYPDGKIVRAHLLVDAWFDGTDESPFPMVTESASSETRVDFYGAGRWRYYRPDQR